MSARILITEGVGFIGTRMAQRLREKSHKLSLHDNSSHQIQGIQGRLPADWNQNCGNVEKLRSVLEFIYPTPFSKRLKLYSPWAGCGDQETTAYDRTSTEMREAGLMHA
jgi:nucleoside-diphosphate-sugar epimerase